MTNLPTYLFAPGRPEWRNPYGPLRWSKTGDNMPQGIMNLIGWPSYAENLVGCGDEPALRENLGWLTFGYGTNAERVSEGAARAVAEYELGEAMAAAHEYEWFKALGNPHGEGIELFTDTCTPRQAVGVILIWRMGAEGFNALLTDLGLVYGIVTGLANWLNLADAGWPYANKDWSRELAEMMRSGEWE